MSELSRMIDQVSRDKGLDREILINTLEEAMRSAAKRKLGSRVEVDVAYNEELGELEVFEFKEVVQEVEDPETQVSMEKALDLDPDCEVGDELGVKVETDDFGRIAAQSAKQVIIQRIKDAERDIIYEDFKDRIGEIINGIVQRFDKGAIIVNLGRTEAVVPPREQVPREGYHPGDRIRAYVLDVRRISRGPQIVLSRTHPAFVEALFDLEVPEISEGIVTIEGAAREPGSRTKLGVSSSDRDVDPVGACVGMKGSRVQAVVQELRGEKIDIISYDPDPAKYVVNALSPAEISRVIVDEVSQTMEVIVADEMLSLAIGRRGQNVRLASKLAGWRIDVQSETKYSEDLRDGYRSLLDVVGVSDIGADTLFQAGYGSAESLAEADPEHLVTLQDIDEERAEQLINDARQYLADRAEGLLEPPSEDEDEDEDEDLGAEAAEDSDQNQEEAQEAAEEDSGDEDVVAESALEPDQDEPDGADATDEADESDEDTAAEAAEPDQDEPDGADVADEAEEADEVEEAGEADEAETAEPEEEGEEQAPPETDAQ